MSTEAVNSQTWAAPFLPVIEQGIPIPQLRVHRPLMNEVLLKMKVGDSVFLPGAVLRNAAANYLTSAGFAVKTKGVKGGGHRLWRIA